jgi:hypothetical protein
LTRGELSDGEYAAAREAYLLPHAERLRQLLNPTAPAPERANAFPQARSHADA